MATCIYMPEVLANMESATILSWSKAVGEPVIEGECIAEIETDKAVIEISAPSAGYLGQIVVPASKKAAAGAVVGVILADKNETIDFESLVSKSPQVVVDQTPLTEPAKPHRHFSSPVARKLAREADICVEDISGSGPRGRVTKRDVEIYIAQKSLTPSSSDKSIDLIDAAVEKRAHTAMRRTIAQRLTQSKSEVPHFYLRAECNVEALISLRKQINAVTPVKVSITDLLVKIIAACLNQQPEMNVSWTDEALLCYKKVDVSVAVSTEKGLLTPVITGADNKTVTAISTEITNLSKRARAGRLQPHEYQGGSITVSNLGMYGVDEFSAIINPPQASILAVGAIQDRAVVNAEGVLVAATMMSVTLSVDHRAVDGVIAAKWLALFKQLVENPLAVLI